MPDPSPLQSHLKMLEALAGVPRSAKNGRDQKYEESNRYLRGRVLARLREEAASGGVTLQELARRLRPNAADVEPLRVKTVVKSLECDGLARVTPLTDRPDQHPAGAVAEERATYAAGTEDGDPGGIRVSLP